MQLLTVVLAHLLLMGIAHAQEAGLQKVKQASPETHIEPVSGIEFIRVEGGCFEMGCGPWQKKCTRDEKPAHEVCVDGFWIGRYEVTQAQWLLFMAHNPSQFRETGEQPVENVSYALVEDYLAKVNQANPAYLYSLPTEAQWEYAARSRGQEEHYAGGKDPDFLGFHGANSENATHPVGSKEPNSLGLYDMSGNVWEWCSDWWAADYQGAARSNPKGPGSGVLKVVRGGGWSHNKGAMRTTGRAADRPDSEKPYNGFRLVMRKR